MEDAQERGALLDRVIAGLGEGTTRRWPLVARAAAALMGAQAAVGFDPAPDPGAAWRGAARWWQEDAESIAQQVVLAELARGARA